MKTIATTILTSKAGKEYNYTMVVLTNCKGCIRSVDVIEDAPSTSPRPYMLLDLLANVMPKNLYAPDLMVELAVNPIYNPKEDYKGHPCLVVHTASGNEKRYRLNHIVNDNWMLSVPTSHIRAMVTWWRTHRDEVQYPLHQWWVWSTKEA